MVSRLRRGRAHVELRFDDPSQTPDAGLLLVAELADRLDIPGTLDRHVGPSAARPPRGCRHHPTRVRCCRTDWGPDQSASVSNSRQDEVAWAMRRPFASVRRASASAVVRPREITVPSQRNAPEAVVTGRRNLVVRSSEV